MMEGKGLEVIDLGTDVAPTTFVARAKEEKAQVIACSALLTTTMLQMEEVVKEVAALNLPKKITVLVGGAPINQDFADRIGADGFAGDGASAAELAVQACLAWVYDEKTRENGIVEESIKRDNELKKNRYKQEETWRVSYVSSWI